VLLSGDMEFEKEEEGGRLYIVCSWFAVMIND